jgi:Uma2 family endonuclease
MELPAKPIARRMTLAEYFAFDAQADTRHEYLDGLVVELNAPQNMAGGSLDHSLITANVIAGLNTALRGTPCHAYSPDTRIRIRGRSKYRYPDSAVVCGDRQVDPEDPTGHTLLNPRVIVEVLSPSSELDDRTDKFTDYMRIPEFEEYVLVSQREARIESLWKQQSGRWSMAFSAGIDASFTLQSLPVILHLREVYAGVTFPAKPEADPLTTG